MAQTPSFKIPIVSFFTGAGFLDMGFLKAGFEVVWHNEFKEAFCEGFEYGMSRLRGRVDWFPENAASCVIQSRRSIEDVTPEAVIQQAFPNGRPALFGMIGGPPCPDFSVGGKNRGATGDNGKLSQVYVDRIMAIKPTFFLFENVKGLINTKKHKAFFDTLRQQLRQDYEIEYRLLNALEYGAPQDRERVFMVGFRREWLKENRLPVPEQSENWFPWTPKPFEGAKDWTGWPTTSSPEAPPARPAFTRGYEQLTADYWIGDPTLSQLPNGTEAFRPKSGKFQTILEGDDSRKSFKRLHRYRYSPTVAYGNNEVHLHPFAPRRLTVREALQLQTVPKEYALPEDMTLSEKFKTIGNGVPVILAESVAQGFKSVLAGKVRVPREETAAD